MCDKKDLHEEECGCGCGHHHDDCDCHDDDCCCGEGEEGVLTLTDEDGVKTDFVVFDSVENNDVLYLALVEKEHIEDDECEYIILKVMNEGEDDELLVTIDDEDEFNTVIKLFEAKAESAGLFDFDISTDEK